MVEPTDKSKQNDTHYFTSHLKVECPLLRGSDWLIVENNLQLSATGAQGAVQVDQRKVTQELEGARWVVQAGVASPVTKPVATATAFPILTMESERSDNI